jgi:hypothetical protein
MMVLFVSLGTLRPRGRERSIDFGLGAKRKEFNKIPGLGLSNCDDPKAFRITMISMISFPHLPTVAQRVLAEKFFIRQFAQIALNLLNPRPGSTPTDMFEICPTCLIIFKLGKRFLNTSTTRLLVCRFLFNVTAPDTFLALYYISAFACESRG